MRLVRIGNRVINMTLASHHAEGQSFTLSGEDAEALRLALSRMSSPATRADVEELRRVAPGLLGDE